MTLIYPKGRLVSNDALRPPEAYYVTIVRGIKIGWLMGPYATKEEAESNVAEARRRARAADPFADFDAFGTAKRTGGDFPPGVSMDWPGA